MYTAAGYCCNDSINCPDNLIPAIQPSSQHRIPRRPAETSRKTAEELKSRLLIYDAISCIMNQADDVCRDSLGRTVVVRVHTSAVPDEPRRLGSIRIWGEVIGEHTSTSKTCTGLLRYICDPRVSRPSEIDKYICSRMLSVCNK